jgi:hypothetical protein
MEVVLEYYKSQLGGHQLSLKNEDELETRFDKALGTIQHLLVWLERL